MKRRGYSSKNPLRNITRVDYERPERSGGGTHGYYVRFHVRGKRVHECFTDAEYGGKDEALAAAKAFRDAYETQFQPQLGKRYRLRPDCRNTSGILGVRKVTTTFPRPDGRSYTYDFWESHWPTPEGGHAKKGFSCHRLGEEGALAAAVAARKEGIARLDEFLQQRENQVFVRPCDGTTIWRYMDFTKFSYLIAHSHLYMPLIRELDDPCEGSFSKANELVRSRLGRMAAVAGLDPKFIRRLRDWIAVSCWHVSEHESAAMWKIYATTSEAISIRSTVGKLRVALPRKVRVASVQYVDYERDWIPEVSPFQPFLYKRRSFEHERELRALALHAESPAFDVFDSEAESPHHGLTLPVNLSDLIEAVYVAPESPTWFLELVKKIMEDRGLASIPVNQSSLEATPIY
ncbi:MAG: hypothetical protein FJ224_04710 [Lentisphaerae bacterium]|nr:hypothetical protein [Lentisphaerota bacterium]